MIRVLACTALLVTLTACGEPAPDPAAVEKMGDLEPLDRALPSETREPRYVGRWGASEEFCADDAWVFTARHLETKGEVSCDFTQVDETPTGYRIAAACVAQGPPTPHHIELSFAESAGAMLVSGGPWDQPIGLVYCGAASEEPAPQSPG
jgi:hypothetical protein